MLERLASLDKPIRVGIVGAGAMGKGLTYQCGVTPGTECVALADILIDRATACAEALGQPYRVVTSAAEMHKACSEDILAVCAVPLAVARLGRACPAMPCPSLGVHRYFYAHRVLPLPLLLLALCCRS